MCTLHICHFSKCPGSCSTSSLLPHILLSLTFFELCYTWNSEVVSSVISDACTFRIPSSRGCIQRLSLKVQVGEWAELLCRLCSEFLEIAVSNGCSIWPCKKEGLHLSLEMVSFLSLNLHQRWYILVCPILRSRIKSYLNGGTHTLKGLQLCWDPWTWNREEQTWFHIESIPLALTFVLCCLCLVMLALHLL